MLSVRNWCIIYMARELERYSHAEVISSGAAWLEGVSMTYLSVAVYARFSDIILACESTTECRTLMTALCSVTIMLLAKLFTNLGEYECNGRLLLTKLKQEYLPVVRNLHLNSDMSKFSINIFYLCLYCKDAKYLCSSIDTAFLRQTAYFLCKTSNWSAYAAAQYSEMLLDLQFIESNCTSTICSQRLFMHTLNVS